MRAVDIIIKKRDGQELSEEEIFFFVQGFSQGEIPDYQTSAWAMAVLLQGMSPVETSCLTKALVASGEQLDLSQVVPLAVDKHSTGGVGDKTTLVVQPIVAARGVPIGKMSGRGLSFTGGTLDKMESIPGYRIDLSTEEFLDQLGAIGMVLCGQTVDLAPADGSLYALRDVTGTVASIPLIASSVMSKKIAGGSNAILLDVKIGLGAFMTTQEDARQLAQLMVEIGKLSDRRVTAVISDMDQPLGCAIGNALEVKEAIETLNGGGPADFKEHCLHIAGHLLVLAGEAENLKLGLKMAENTLKDGSALGKFKALVDAQDGEVSYVEDPKKLPKSAIVETIPSEQAGYISEIHAREVGLAAMDLGAGRAKKGQAIDHAVGVMIHQKVGNKVNKGEALFTVHAQNSEELKQAIDRLMAAHKFSHEPVEPLPLFYDTIQG